MRAKKKKKKKREVKNVEAEPKRALWCVWIELIFAETENTVAK